MKRAYLGLKYIVVSTIFLTSISQAGVKEGGGGNAVVCRDLQGKIKSAELQDIFEARMLFGLNVPSSELPHQEQLDAMLNRVKQAQQNGWRPDWNEIIPKSIADDLILLPSGVGLGEIDDTQPTIVPKGCKLERLALYDDRYGQLFVDSEIWNHLGETNRAALLLHENVYYYLRQHAGETTSDRTRYAVGYVASDLPLKNIFDGIPSGVELINCWVPSNDKNSSSTPFRFVAYRTPVDPSTVDAYQRRYQYFLKFYVFNGLPLILQKTVTFTSPDLYQMGIQYGERDFEPHVDLSSEYKTRDSINLVASPREWNGSKADGVAVRMTITDGFYPRQEMKFKYSVQCDNGDPFDRQRPLLFKTK
jgi:hypothetical protein